MPSFKSLLVIAAVVVVVLVVINHLPASVKTTLGI